MPLVDMLNIIKNTFTQLEQIPRKKEKQKTKILQLPQKKQGYKFLKYIRQVLSEKNTLNFLENYSPTMVADMLYSSADVKCLSAYTKTFSQISVLK